MKFNPELDIALERTVDLPADKIYKAWTTPALLTQWFCPKPWTTPSCEVDLRPGGKFNFVMKSPEGQEMPNAGCFLEVVENQKLVWTDGMTEGYRLKEQSFFTASITLKDLGNGKTLYRAEAFHKNPQDRKTHADMGFEQGWGICLDQLIELMKNQ